MYTIENYKGCRRFNNMYAEIYKFLQVNADSGYNEHFHWGRFEWMMTHPQLNTEMLSKIALFRDNSNNIVGVVIYDTDIENRWYILHSISEENLLKDMIKYINYLENDNTIIKVNNNDDVLCMLLENMGYERQYEESVLEMKLPFELKYHLSNEFSLNALNSVIDNWQWQLVIHHGFENEGMPKEHDKKIKEAEKHLESIKYIKVFAVKNKEYVSHCGIWYDCGETAYIEPVVTIPEYRSKGLAKAVVYEAMKRAKAKGAKRAIVLSDLEFYWHIGMTKSSKIITYVKNSKNLEY